MHDQSASRISGRTRAAVSAMCVRPLRIMILKSAGNFTRDEYTHLNAEKFSESNVLCSRGAKFLRASNFPTPARPSRFENFCDGQLVEVAVYLAIPRKLLPILSQHVRWGRVEDGRGSLGHSATLRFPSPLIEPDVPISGIRLSDWLHREVHGEQTNRARLRHGE
jgi:hypothetical protein